ncbi:MAG TPA: hypothetical protein VL201_04200 [Patescibacteria group bacterium]|jgi:hypothetical protein|nr:hypothetical protein [Patescibacteria group bacterium]
MNYKNKFFLLMILTFCQGNNVWALPQESNQYMYPRFIYNHHDGRRCTVETKITDREFQNHERVKKQRRLQFIEKLSVRGFFTGLTGLTVSLWFCLTHK